MTPEDRVRVQELVWYAAAIPLVLAVGWLLGWLGLDGPGWFVFGAFIALLVAGPAINRWRKQMRASGDDSL